MVFQAGLESQIRLELLTHLSQILGGKLMEFMHNIKCLSQVGIRNGWASSDGTFSRIRTASPSWFRQKKNSY